MADPFDQFATVSDDEFAQFAPVDAAPVKLSKEQYHARITQLVRAGDKAGLEQLAQQQGTQLNNLDEAIAAARQGRGFNIADEGGETTTSAQDETIGQALYRGAGDVVAGLADIPGLIANPLGMGMNYISNKLGYGQPFSEDVGQSLRDATGAPSAVTDTERYISGATRSGAGAVGTAGAAAPLRAAEGMTGYVANRVAATAAGDFVGGLAGGVGAEGGGDVGAKVGGTAGRVAGSLLGGVAGGASGARASEAAALRMTKLAPRSVIIDANGGLTDEGRELAARLGAREDDVARAYGRTRETRVPDSRSLAERQAGREAWRNRSPEQQVRAQEALAGREPQTAPTAEAPIARPLGEQNDAIQSEIQRRLQTGEAFDAPNAPPPPPRDPFTEAREEGVQLTRGQAEQDFDVQNDENSLRVSATGAGEQARQFFQEQQRQIAGAIERFRTGFGPDAGNAADRGEVLQTAVRQLRDSGAEGVRTLYREAEALGGDGLRLETKGIHDAATDVLIDEAVPETVKKAIGQELARYGIIGEAAPINEAGITRVTLDDGSTVAFRGPTKQLTASNAEDLRKAVNRLYMSDPTRASQGIKPAIDDALEAALTKGATEGQGQIGAAYSAARDAYRVQRGTFHAKDIIDSIIANKKGTGTIMLPEKAIAQVIGAGAKGVSNLRQTKGLLLASGTDHGRQAWAAIQHQGLADIFDSALSRNVNHGNGQIGDVISGAKLNSAIEKFGTDKLRTLLSTEDFNGLMKLRRIIGVATIPISGTTNPSGTATKIINYMRAGTLRFSSAIPGLGGAVNAFAGLAAKGKEIAATRKTLAGITAYDGQVATGKRLDQQARDFVREYVDSGSAGKLVPTSINLTATQGASRRD